MVMEGEVTAVALYVTLDGLISPPLLVGVKVIEPASIGVIVNICGVTEPLKVKMIGVLSPPPEGVRVIVPVYAALGVTVKLVDVVLMLPEAEPLKVKVVATTVVVNILSDEVISTPFAAVLFTL